MRAYGRLAVVSWLGGTVSIVPFAEDWFELSRAGTNWALFGALVSAAVLGLAFAASPSVRGFVAALAGPPDPPARALVLAAVLAGAGALAMLATLWLLAR